MRIANAALNLAMLALVASAVVVTALAVRRELHARDVRAWGRDIDNWQQYAQHGNRIGPNDARVTMVIFADFQCAYCSRFHKAVSAIYRDYSTQVALVYRHFPLSRHPHARSAALASECAAQQNSFRSFTDVLYTKQDSIGILSWESLAASAAVPSTSAFLRCISGAQQAFRLTEDSLAADALGVTGTPTFLVNERRIAGALTEDQLRRIVQDRLN